MDREIMREGELKKKKANMSIIYYSQILKENYNLGNQDKRWHVVSWGKKN